MSTTLFPKDFSSVCNAVLYQSSQGKLPSLGWLSKEASEAANVLSNLGLIESIGMRKNGWQCSNKHQITKMGKMAVENLIKKNWYLGQDIKLTKQKN